MSHSTTQDNNQATFTILSYSIKRLLFTVGLNLALASVLMIYRLYYICFTTWFVCINFLFVCVTHPTSVIEVKNCLYVT